MKQTIILAIFLAGSLIGKTQNKESYLFIGSYGSEGIHVYKFNSETAEASPVSSVTTHNASYIAMSPNENFVYAVNEDANDTGSIAAFSFNKKNGTLTFLNKTISGNHPCYVTIDKTGKWVFAANYTGGSLAEIAVKQDGSLADKAYVIQHTGSSINKERQDKPHVHSTVLSPDNKLLFVADLGMDKLMIYSFDKTTGKLAPAQQQSFMQSEPGSGPRHFTFHPNGKYAYLIEELSGTIEAFQYSNGELKHIQRISSTPTDKTGYAGSADIHISPDGKFLYGSNRGDFDNISIYKIDTDNGQLTNIGLQSALGKVPRNFNFDPSGNFLLVANQESNEVVIFKRDKETGLLTDTGKRIQVNKPVCVKWASIK